MFVGFIENWCFSDVKTLVIIIISGNDTLKVLGFKGTHKIDIVKALAIIIASGSDILKVLGFKSTQKNCFQIRKFFHLTFQDLSCLTILVKMFVKIWTYIGTSIIKKQINYLKRNNGEKNKTHKQTSDHTNKQTNKQRNHIVFVLTSGHKV